MAQIILDIPTDAAQTRIVNALCADGGWSADLGITKAKFAKKMIADMVRDRVQATETRLARAEAVAAVTPVAQIDVT